MYFRLDRCESAVSAGCAAALPGIIVACVASEAGGKRGDVGKFVACFVRGGKISSICH